MSEDNISASKKTSSDLEEEPYLSFWKRFLLGLPSEIYFFIRYAWLLLTTRSSFFEQDIPEQESSKKSAVIFVHGLFGTSHQFIDIKESLKQDNPDMRYYYYSYDHGNSLEEDSKKFREYLSELDEDKIDLFIIVAHSRGGVLSYDSIMQVGETLAQKMRLITLASPFQGAELADLIHSQLKEEKVVFKPIRDLLSFIVSYFKTEKIFSELNTRHSLTKSHSYRIDEKAKRLQDHLYHLIAEYDVVVGNHLKQQTHDKFIAEIVTIPCSHAGILYSRGSLEAINNLVQKIRTPLA